MWGASKMPLEVHLHPCSHPTSQPSVHSASRAWEREAHLSHRCLFSPIRLWHQKNNWERCMLPSRPSYACSALTCIRAGNCERESTVRGLPGLQQWAGVRDDICLVDYAATKVLFWVDDWSQSPLNTHTHTYTYKLLLLLFFIKKMSLAILLKCRLNSAWATCWFGTAAGVAKFSPLVYVSWTVPFVGHQALSHNSFAQFQWHCAQSSLKSPYGLAGPCLWAFQRAAAAWLSDLTVKHRWWVQTCPAVQWLEHCGVAEIERSVWDSGHFVRWIERTMVSCMSIPGEPYYKPLCINCGIFLI